MADADFGGTADLADATDDRGGSADVVADRSPPAAPEALPPRAGEDESNEPGFDEAGEEDPAAPASRAPSRPSSA
ncbi:hypothetical protein [Candidatus Frankia alpina]|uniref:Uncharacterized protein n=1 Tax=Candidatus Frankia alpina TaxID=2699483 RepID=A0A4S5ET33_9ACTN|nr:hypothetical protein [Candidatus Frankia alpina]THJ75695.1 hypothetical protein E7Y31_03965 [Candidatus Frankia alpina]